ncbi:hypothetical protein [Streptomyces hirsutus]|uniref:hypothetical protein n=1 Tax=Streptomyces hirsutus TaxID=35620 RepID=UPI00367EBAF8
MVVATGDTATVTDLAAYEKALRLKRLELIRGGHFDPCIAQFDTSSRAAVAWFRDHLAKAPGAGMPHLTYTPPPRTMRPPSPRSGRMASTTPRRSDTGLLSTHIVRSAALLSATGPKAALRPPCRSELPGRLRHTIQRAAQVCGPFSDAVE